MNRRNMFIAVAAAVAAATVRWPDLHWLRPKSFLYVVPTPRQAEALYNELGRPRNVKVINTGAMICGYGADLIIMDENWDEDHKSGVRREYVDSWFNNSIRCRLYRDGRIITRRLT